MDSSTPGSNPGLYKNKLKRFAGEGKIVSNERAADR